MSNSTSVGELKKRMQEELIKSMVESATKRLECKRKSVRNRSPTSNLNKKHKKTGVVSVSNATENNESQIMKSEVIFPHISKQKWQKFEREINDKEIRKISKQFDICLARLHSYERLETHFWSLENLRKAIVDSLLNRKWDNFLKLVVLMMKSYNKPAFRPIVRHLCQILKHYHPSIRGTKYAEEIDLIVAKSDRKEGPHEARN